MCSLFLLMLRRPPSPPLFPYTTLFRSVLRVDREAVEVVTPVGRRHAPHLHVGNDLSHAPGEATGVAYEAWLRRSEEHTSELQSQSNLVCRLLLEKKKNLAPTSRMPQTR